MSQFLPSLWHVFSSLIITFFISIDQNKHGVIHFSTPSANTYMHKRTQISKKHPTFFANCIKSIPCTRANWIPRSDEVNKSFIWSWLVWHFYQIYTIPMRGKGNQFDQSNRVSIKKLNSEGVTLWEHWFGIYIHAHWVAISVRNFTWISDIMML